MTTITEQRMTEPHWTNKPKIILNIIDCKKEVLSKYYYDHEPNFPITAKICNKTPTHQTCVRIWAERACFACVWVPICMSHKKGYLPSQWSKADSKSDGGLAKSGSSVEWRAVLLTVWLCVCHQCMQVGGGVYTSPTQCLLSDLFLSHYWHVSSAMKWWNLKCNTNTGLHKDLLQCLQQRPRHPDLCYVQMGLPGWWMSLFYFLTTARMSDGALCQHQDVIYHNLWWCIIVLLN